MPRTASRKVRATSHCIVADKPSAAQLVQQQAAETMWAFYRNHKTQLVEEVRSCREEILAALIQGVPVEQVFAPYFRPAAAVQPVHRAEAGIRRAA